MAAARIVGTCSDCGCGITTRSTGRCKPCALKHAYRSPEARAKLSALMKAQWADPWFRQAQDTARRERMAGDV